MDIENMTCKELLLTFISNFLEYEKTGNKENREVLGDIIEFANTQMNKGLWE